MIQAFICCTHSYCPHSWVYIGILSLYWHLKGLRFYWILFLWIQAHLSCTRSISTLLVLLALCIRPSQCLLWLRFYERSMEKALCIADLPFTGQEQGTGVVVLSEKCRVRSNRAGTVCGQTHVSTLYSNWSILLQYHENLFDIFVLVCKISWPYFLH